ncbi:MAG: hypothetical protein MJB14_11260 [Spirochaetes bacterium]|nr:hypothetical protein [Spirochaetota bacterium]
MGKHITKFFLFIISISLFTSGGLELKKISPPDQLSGSSYFPLFIGEKWSWKVHSNQVSNVDWEIIDCYLMIDRMNGIKGNIVYELHKGNQGGRFFLFEHQGFICEYYYTESQLKYTKLLPLHPQIGMDWQNGRRTFTISELNKNLIKVEIIEKNRDKNFIIFQKSKGPIEFTVVDLKQNQKYLYQLYKYHPFSNLTKLSVLPKVEDINKQFENEFVKKASEIIMDEDIDIVNEIEPFIDSLEKYRINELNRKHAYIQVGAYQFKKNAQSMVIKLVEKKYPVVVWLDQDGTYKVLLQLEKITQSYLSLIQKEITPHAFIKKR